MAMHSRAALALEAAAAFRRWERRGRGWDVHPEPVHLEPALVPFRLPRPQVGRAPDDGRKPTVGSRFFDWILARDEPEESAPEPGSEIDELPEGIQLSITPPLRTIGVGLRADSAPRAKLAGRFLLSLGHLSHPASFEYLATEREITPFLTCAEADTEHVLHQLAAHFPAVDAEVIEDPVSLSWERTGSAVLPLVVEFGLAHEFLLPLPEHSKLDPDPHLGLLGALGGLRSGESAVFQVLFEPVRGDWVGDVVEAFSEFERAGFRIDACELIEAARRKFASSLFAAVARVGAQSPEEGRSWEILSNAASALAPFGGPGSNELFPLSNTGCDPVEQVEDLLARRSHRTGMILNAEELKSLAHLPSSTVSVPRLRRANRATRAVPEAARSAGILLGTNRHRGADAKVYQDTPRRLRHTHLVGASGTGKSTLLLSMIEQDLQEGSGLAVLDPHGDLIEDVLARIPAARIPDVVVFDPSDEGHPVGFNVLHARSSAEKHLLASDLVALFRRFATSWGDQMTSVLANAVLALLESPEGGTLADLRRFLVEAEFRRRFLDTVLDPEVRYFWDRQFPLLSGKPQAPILTRLDSFLRHRLVREIVSQRESRLDLGAVVNGKGVVLCKLSEGVIGEENAYLLGTLLVSKLHQVAMARQQDVPEDRDPFYLYVDECHHFVTPSMASLLAGARKYGLGLVLAHQDLSQLHAQSPEMESALLTNAATRVVFRVSGQDARTLASGFDHFESVDLQRLGVGDAVCRIERSDWDFNLRTSPLAEPNPVEAAGRRAQIIARSRERYATPSLETDARDDVRQLRFDGAGKSKGVPVPGLSGSAVAFEKREKPERTEQPRQAARPARRAAGPPKMQGRGGGEHKRLQALIKRRSEDRGWRAEIEKEVSEGRGRVDVALERDGWRVACEISVSSGPTHERANVRKCLEAGFDDVVLVADDRTWLQGARDPISEGLSAEDLARLHFLAPEEMFVLLEEREAHLASGEGRVAGLEVSVDFRVPGDREKALRTRGVLQVLADTARRSRRDRAEETPSTR